MDGFKCQVSNIILKGIVDYICSEHNLTFDEALSELYNSDFFDVYSNRCKDLWEMPPGFILNLYKKFESNTTGEPVSFGGL